MHRKKIFRVDPHSEMILELPPIFSEGYLPRRRPRNGLEEEGLSMAGSACPVPRLQKPWQAFENARGKDIRAKVKVTLQLYR
jgi:hypothetical protein